jgi:hypothetical protein
MARPRHSPSLSTLQPFGAEHLSVWRPLASMNACRPGT